MDVRPIAVLVDDNRSFLSSLSNRLRRMNLEVMTASHAAEALEMSRVTVPDVVTMDMMLPDMDGLAALRAFRNDGELADLPIIMISSYRDKTREWEALRLGCVDVLDKPIDLQRLHRSIQNCELFPYGRRRFTRAPFARIVNLHYRGRCYLASSESLSAQGIFLRMHEKPPKGSPVAVELSLVSGEVLSLEGTVIYNDRSRSGEALPDGLAIKFDSPAEETGEFLNRLVVELLLENVTAEQ